MVAAAAATGLIFLFSYRPVRVQSDPAQAVYRRQLDEIEDLAGRGLLGEDERKSARAEAARRLLGEKHEAEEKPGGQKVRMAAAGAAALVAVAALGAYLAVGRPDLPDQPFAARLKVWTDEFPSQQLAPDQAAAVLGAALKNHPGEPELLAALADAEINAGNPLRAQRHIQEALKKRPDNANYWQLLGEIRYTMAGGEVDAPTRQALEKALSLDPSLLIPVYFLAVDDVENGRKEQGLAALRSMRDKLPPEGQRELDSQIAQLETGPQAPAAAPGAPGENPAILAMVQGLAARLEQNPDDPEGWARLIRSYTVLGDTAARDKALDKARALFKDRPRDLATIESAMNAPQ